MPMRAHNPRSEIRPAAKRDLPGLRHDLQRHGMDHWTRPTAPNGQHCFSRRPRPRLNAKGNNHENSTHPRPLDCLQAHLPSGNGRVALLVWGDPALYDSTLRIASRLGLNKAQVHVVPGITSMQVLCSAHGIALNEIGAPFLVTTGRQLRESGWPQGINTLVVMLDGQASYEQLTEPDIDIFWGAYLGMPQQILMQGRLSEIKDSISATRQQARQLHSWIMDIYLLRRN